jgi:hypothetical protein
MPLLLYISTVREYGRFRSNWLSLAMPATTRWAAGEIEDRYGAGTLPV